MFYPLGILLLEYLFIRCSVVQISKTLNECTNTNNLESKNKKYLSKQQCYSKVEFSDKSIDKNNLVNTNDEKNHFGIFKRQTCKRKLEMCNESDKFCDTVFKKDDNDCISNKICKNNIEPTGSINDAKTKYGSEFNSVLYKIEDDGFLLVSTENNDGAKRNKLDLSENSDNEEDFLCNQLTDYFEVEMNAHKFNRIFKKKVFKRDNKYLNIFNDKFCSKIHKKYSFHLYYLINICCNTYLTDHNNTNKVEKYGIEKFIHFINLDNEVQLISLRKNFFTRDTFHPYYVKCFVAYVNKLYDNYKYLLDYRSDMGFFKEKRGKFSKNYNWKQKKIAKYSKIENVFINDIKYKLIFPELNIIKTLMDELVQYDTKGSNSFLIIISIVCIILEIKCDSFLSSDKFADQNYDMKIYLHYIELLKVRSFLLIFYIKYFTYKPIVIKGIIVCFLNYMVVNNWEFIKVDIKILFSKFNETVKKIIDVEKDLKKLSKKSWAYILINKSFLEVISGFTNEVFFTV